MKDNTNMKKMTALVSLSVISVLSIFGIQSKKRVTNIAANVNYVENIGARIDFEDYILPGSANYSQERSWKNLIWTGDVYTTASYKIDNKTLGMRIPKDTITSRVLTIDISGYSKVVLDIKLQATTTRLDFGCGREVFTTNTTVRDFEILVNSEYNNPKLTITFSPDGTSKSNRDAGIDNIRFYTIQ